MGVTDKMWDAITSVIRMNDKVERVAATMVTQQRKIKSLTERVNSPRNGTGNSIVAG